MFAICIFHSTDLQSSYEIFSNRFLVNYFGKRAWFYCWGFVRTNLRPFKCHDYGLGGWRGCGFLNYRDHQIG